MKKIYYQNYPINAMGISKAMMEHVIYANARVAAERGGTTICCTRYGNVMCSRGWVLHLLVRFGLAFGIGQLDCHLSAFAKKAV